MPKLDLVNARQIKSAAGEWLQAKAQGWTWTKPTVGGHPLQPYFDSGAILIYLSDENATLDASGNVVALQNIGGAGGTFSATVVGNALPLVNGMLQFSGSTGGYVQLNNAADIRGVDFCWIMQTTWTNNMRLFGRPSPDPQTDIRFDTNATGTNLTLRRVVGGTTTLASLSPRFPYTTATALFRISMGATTGSFFQNGAWARSFDHSYADFPLLDLGKGLDNSVRFNGGIGDVFGVLSDHPQAAAALTAAQNYVAAKHGITLA